MTPIQALLFTVAISTVPAILFVGFVSVLRRMQNAAMLQVVSDRAGVEAEVVTFGDAFRGLLGLQNDYTERPGNGEYRY